MVVRIPVLNFSTTNRGASNLSTNVSDGDTLVPQDSFGLSRTGHTVVAVAKTNLQLAQRREQHILIMVLSMVSCYLLCWMPYGVMALVATFGRSGLVTPVASVVPTVLAKSSTVINPVIYVLFNNQFHRCFVAFHSLGSPHTLGYRNPSNSPPCGLRSEWHTGSLVGHYTP
nr:pinopsin-like [Salvelinus alpinus]